MFAPILAMIDMRGNWIAAVILLMIGVVVLGIVRPPSVASSSRRWLPIVAFISGPFAAFLWTIADAVWIQPGSYVNVNEYLQTLPPVLITGVTGGAAGAFVFWVGDRLTQHRVR